MWKRLSHPNIVPFLGVTDAPAPLSIVSEWMPNGDIRHHVGEHPEVDRIQLVCHTVFFVVLHEFLLASVAQLLDICHGLQVLHTHDIVHGDLKGVRPNYISPYPTDQGSNRFLF